MSLSIICEFKNYRENLPSLAYYSLFLQLFALVYDALHLRNSGILFEHFMAGRCFIVIQLLLYTIASLRQFGQFIDDFICFRMLWAHYFSN